MGKRKILIALVFLAVVGVWALMSFTFTSVSVLTLSTKWKVEKGSSASVLSYTVEVSNHGPWPIVVHYAHWQLYPSNLFSQPLTDNFELFPYGTQQVLGGVIGCGFQEAVQCPAQIRVTLDAQATMMFRTEEITLTG